MTDTIAAIATARAPAAIGIVRISGPETLAWWTAYLPPAAERAPPHCPTAG